MLKGDIKLMKNINEQIVINLLRENGHLSSLDLVNMTGLNKSTIASIIKTLTEANFIDDLGKGSSTVVGGRRPMIWEINGDAYFSIGIDIELDELNIVVMNLKGDVVNKSFIKYKSKHLYSKTNDFIEFITMTVNKTLKELSISKKIVIGVGVGLGGIIDSKNGTVISSEIFSNINLPIRKELENNLKLPVYIENNANVSAIGAKWNGVAKDCTDFISVLLEISKDVSGIGVGIIINNKLYTGACSCAGEINIVTPRLAYIINNLRNILSEGELLQKYITTPSKLTLEIVMNAAKKGDLAAIRIVETLANHIGEIISGTVAVLNPEMVVISGTIAELGELFINPLLETLSRKTHTVTSGKIKIKVSKFGRYAVATGAAALAFKEFYKVPEVRIRKKLKTI
jgi:N-acetylglucosamine repressor